MLKDKLRKILELANRGIGGEQANAQSLLSDLLKQHNLTLDDIASEERYFYWLRYKYPFERQLIIQILSHILDSKTIMTRKQQGKKAVGVSLTVVQYESFREFWATYRKPLTDEVMKYIDSIFSAYIAKHGLFSSHVTEANDLSAEEIQRLRDIMSGLKPIMRPAKQIEGGINDR